MLCSVLFTLARPSPFSLFSIEFKISCFLPSARARLSLRRRGKRQDTLEGARIEMNLPPPTNSAMEEDPPPPPPDDGNVRQRHPSPTPLYPPNHNTNNESRRFACFVSMFAVH